MRALLCTLTLIVALPARAGVDYYLVALPETKVQGVAQSEAALSAALFERQNPDRLYLEKSWHGIHWLLSRSADRTAEPLSTLIMGGQPIGAELAYGQPRLHSAAEVKKFAALLQRVDVDVIAKNYDVAAMDAAHIYPVGWGDEPDNLEILKSFFVELRDFYIKAAKDGKAVLFAWG